MYRVVIGDDESRSLKELSGMVSRCLEHEGLHRGTDCAVEAALHRAFLHRALEN